jgi:histidyl-tRNA synthetase
VVGKELKAIRGMNDILPEDMPYWHRLEAIMRKTVASAGYQEIRCPVLEFTELFTRSIGDETDIVSKEMYTFFDRNQESLSLRPEGTACTVRAGIEHGLFYNQLQRLWYSGPMFRYEKPQKGRYRQFHQFGVEAYGMEGPAIEAELLGLSAQLWSELRLESSVKLQLNHLGTKAMRANYREALVIYLERHKAILDADSQHRLRTNPLRVLDSKNPALQTLLNEAPKIAEYLDKDSLDHRDRLQEYLQSMSIPYELNDRLVRGLDYYDGVVFEWVTDQLGAQGTVCAGGRYDGLVEQLGGRKTPAVGFACGLERLVLLMQKQSEQTFQIDLLVLVLDESAMAHAFLIVKQLRDAMPEQVIVLNMTGGKLKNQLQRADKSQAHYALLIGESEKEMGQYRLKPLRTREEQQTLTIDECIAFLQSTRHKGR